MPDRIIYFLLCFPLGIAFSLALVSNPTLRRWIVWLGSFIIIAASLLLAVKALGPGFNYFHFESHFIDKLFFGLELLLGLYLLYRCKNIVKNEIWIPVLILLQTAILVYCERGRLPAVQYAFYADNFSIIMALIIGIIGTLICVYALSYMREYHVHHAAVKNRQKFFFFLLFAFLSAMFGIVFTNNLLWLFLFWEVTTLCSFEMIGYSRDEEATRNAYRALGLNAVGGLAFSAAIYCLVFLSKEPTLELNRVIAMGPGLALIPAMLLCLAGLTKSAQMPFSSWLLGAMVAPTPVSALLHSSTMVKAGVFIIVKFAFLLQGTYAGMALALVGGISFFMTSLMAVTQSNAKRVLAYSTIANLGLIVMCAGVGTPRALWAAMLLIIFHAIAKGLLFLGVGTIEHKINSRDIEDMGGLIGMRTGLAVIMVIGMLGMFLAPFGMLIGKWACLEALLQTSPILAVLLAFGSAPTLFFWAKWMGKIVSVPLGYVKEITAIPFEEKFVLATLAAATVLSCGFFPFIAGGSIEPYIRSIYLTTVTLGKDNALILLIMLGTMLLLPLSFLLLPRRTVKKPAYLAGANVRDPACFLGAMGLTRPAVVRNYYLSDIFDEKNLTRMSVIMGSLTIFVMFAVIAL